MANWNELPVTWKRLLANRSQLQPDRAEFEAVSSARGWLETRQALLSAQESAENVAGFVERIVAASWGAVSHQEAADSILGRTNEGVEKGPGSLDGENFRIDSDGWDEALLCDGTRVKRNPEGDVTELLEGQFAGEQHFTWEAAVRETAKAGKRIPTREEWALIVERAASEIEPNEGRRTPEAVAICLGLAFAGSRSAATSSYYGLGRTGGYWSSSIEGSRWFHVSLSRSWTLPSAYDHLSTGLSVRCFAD